jgi:small subunit ribosomal protein S1
MSKNQRLTLADMRPKMELTGTVKRIELAGAILDVHAEVDALLHISEIQSGRVKNVGDILEEGKEVVAWVKAVDPERGALSVTMIRPPAVDWNEIEVGKTFQGKVVRIEKFGVFVDIGAERSGLVHVSEMASDYVTSPGDMVEQGDEVEVRVIGVNRKKNQIDLSMKQLAPIAAEEDEIEADDDTPTAMALAYQRAMGSTASTASPETTSTKSATRKKVSAEQEEILNRTLQRLENT